MCVNGINIYQLKAKGSEIKPYLLCLGNISKILQPRTWHKTGLNGYVHNFSLDYNIGINDVVDIHKYLMKMHDIKPCLGWLNKYLLHY